MKNHSKDSLAVVGKQIIGSSLFTILLMAMNISATSAEDIFQLPIKHGRYQVKITARHDQGNRLVITKDGKTLIDQSANNFAVVDPTSAEPNLGYVGKRLPLFDLNGDGTQDLIVRIWTGGAHCCYTYNIYSLGKTCKRIWHFDAKDGHMQKIKFNKHTSPNIFIEDCTFRYFGAGVYKMPIVALRWQNGKFSVDLGKMKAGLQKGRQTQRLSKLRKDLEKGYEGSLYEYLLNLYYSGHAQEGIKLMFSLLPQSQTAARNGANAPESAKHFHASFVHQLRRSPFFLAIKSMNNNKL